MQKTKWPKWAPQDAIDFIEYYESDHGPGYWGIAELRLLLTEDTAKSVWSKLARTGIGVESFCKAVLAALEFPESNKTPGEFRNHLALIAKKAYELAFLIGDVPSINALFLCQHQETWAGVISKQQTIIEDNHFYRYYPTDLVDTLMFISDTAEQHAQLLYERPNVENAFPLFFIKSLDGFFRLTTHRPHTGITLICTEIFFPDYPVSKKSIERATSRKIPPIKRKIMANKGG